MPLPTPRQGENRAEFISRCASDENVQAESSSNEQAVAICGSIYDRERAFPARAPNVNSELLEAVKSRDQKPDSFGYGIITADRYVRTLLDAVGSDSCYAAAATRHVSFDDVMQKAAKTLVYSNPRMEVENKQTGAFELPGAPPDFVLPKNTLMVLDHWVTTPRIDRDGDILRSEGMVLDPKMLMLWQHVHTMPIGKYLYTLHHSEKGIRVASAIVDMGDVAHDAAVMAENDMLRFSHGFRAIEFEQMKADEGETTNGGFEVTKGEIMEESGVSVPSNVDAETEGVMLSLIESGKLTSGIMKDYGKHLRDRRPVTEGIRFQERNGDYERSIETTNRADFVAVFKTSGDGNENKPAGSGTGSQGKGKGQRTGPAPEEANGQGQEDKAAASGEEVTASRLITVDELKRHGGVLSGSWESIEHALSQKAKRYLIAMGTSIGEHDWAYLIGTFSDHTVVCVEKPEAGVIDEFRYFKISWEIKDSEPEFVGDPQSVDIVTTTEMRERSPLYDRKKDVDDSQGDIQPEKRGRALSRANENRIKAVKEDIDEVLGMDGVPRPAKAMLRECNNELKTVLDSLGMEDEASNQPAGTNGSVEGAMAIVIASANQEQKDRLRNILDALSKQSERDKRTKQFRAFVGA